MKQRPLAGLERYRKTTRRAQSLAEMDRIVPWPALEAVVEPAYPNVSEAGAHRFLWSGCCAATVCSCGSTCRTRR
jgi:hypothetical protein